jgi:endoglucanase
MKNTFRLFGIIALVAVIGFSFATLSLTSCGGGDSGPSPIFFPPEDDNYVTIDGWSWYVFNDSTDGGTSTIAMSRGSGDDSKKLTFSGNVRKIQGQTWGFAGWGTDPDSANLTDLKNTDSFSFKCTGYSRKYWVLVVTSDVTDSDYHHTVFTVSPTEKTITVKYSDLKQEGWGAKKPFNKNNIKLIDFHARPEITGEGPFSVTMWDLKVNE